MMHCIELAEKSSLTPRSLTLQVCKGEGDSAGQRGLMTWKLSTEGELPKNYCCKEQSYVRMPRIG